MKNVSVLLAEGVTAHIASERSHAERPEVSLRLQLEGAEPCAPLDWWAVTFSEEDVIADFGNKRLVISENEQRQLDAAGWKLLFSLGYFPNAWSSRRTKSPAVETEPVDISDIASFVGERRKSNSSAPLPSR